MSRAGMWNALAGPGFTLPVTDMKKTARAQDRAARLHREAINCLKIAVAEETHSAELIDEALKLAKRSRELNDTG